MSAVSMQVQATTPTDLAGLWSAIVTWLRKNTREAVFSAVIGAVIGYMANALLMIFVYEGYKFTGGLATAKGNFVMGFLIWGIGSTIVFSLIGYRRAVGKERFWQDVRNLPATIEMLLRQDGQLARVHLLWGAAVSLLAMQFISPWLGVVLAVGLFSALPSLLGRILSNLLLRTWSALVNLVAPTRGQSVGGPMAMTVGILGASAALMLGFFITGSSVKLVLALVCAIAAGVLTRQGSPSSNMPLLLLLSMAGVLWEFLYDLLHPLIALADDGGWREAGGNFNSWIRSAGAVSLLGFATGGAGAGAVGGAVGSAIGSVLGSGSQPSGGPGIIDPWTSKPLTVWEPGRFGPGENGQEGRPGQVWFGGNWVDPDYVRDFIRDSLAADQRREAESRRFAEEGQRRSEDWLRNREAQLQQEARQERDRRRQDDEARCILDEIKNTADRHGWDDIWNRAVGSGRTRPDGTLDPDYVNRLRGILRGRLGQDIRQPYEPAGYRSPFDDFVSNTVDAIRHNTAIRIVTGILTGSSSEVFYQSQAAWEAMQRSFNQAAERGRSWGITDALRGGYGNFARENLPLNTLEALADPNRRTFTGIAGSLVGDTFSALGVRDTARNLRASVDVARGGRGIGDVLTARANSAVAAAQSAEPAALTSRTAPPPAREGLGAQQLFQTPAGVRDAEGRWVINTPQHPYLDHRRNVPLPREMRNPGSQVELQNCVPTSVYSVQTHLPYDEIEKRLAPFRLSGATPTSPMGGVPPYNFRQALEVTNLNPRPVSNIVAPAGGKLSHAEVADRLGEYLRNNPNTKVICPVRTPKPGGGFTTNPNHAVVIHGVEIDPITNQVRLQVYEPGFGVNLSIPPEKLGWAPGQAYVVRPSRPTP